MLFLLPHPNPIKHRFAKKAVTGTRTPPWRYGVLTLPTAEFLEKDLHHSQWAPGVLTRRTAEFLGKDLPHSWWALGDQTQDTAGCLERGRPLPQIKFSFPGSSVFTCLWSERGNPLHLIKFSFPGSLTFTCQWSTNVAGLTFGASTGQSFFHGNSGWVSLERPFSTRRSGDLRAQKRQRKARRKSWVRGPWRLCCPGGWASKVQC